MPLHSRLARLLQLVLLAQAVLAVAWVAWRGPEAPLRAAAGVLFLVLLAPAVLALEFGLSAFANRRDARSPLAGPMQLVAAWFVETAHLFATFAWRQPFRWRAVDDQVGDECADRTGVVFVHGFMCNRGFWTAWLRRMRARGRACIAVNLEPVFGEIDAYAPIIDAAVARVAQATGRAPMLVCHSMGGLAARAWWRASAGKRPVAALVTIGSPHGGTWTGRFSLHANARQMRMRSEWLRELAAHEAAHPLPPTTCWYSNCDNMVFPAATATLPHAENRFIGGRPHLALAFVPQVIEGTLQRLDELDAAVKVNSSQRTLSKMAN
jgi:triacylglycerol lipase